MSVTQCNKCDLKDCRIKFLLEKIKLYEDILKTSRLMGLLDESVSRNNTEVHAETQTFISGNIYENDNFTSPRLDTTVKSSTISLLSECYDNDKTSVIASEELSINSDCVNKPSPAIVTPECIGVPKSTVPQSDDTTACGYVETDPYQQTHNSGPRLRSERPSDFSKLGSTPVSHKNLHYGRPDEIKSALYISSSMFRHLDTSKLSSNGMVAQKLFYPGASAEIMLKKLKCDIDKIERKPDVVFIMCGTNNVDSIYYGSRELRSAADDIINLINFVKTKFPTAMINIMNILPRLSPGRNDVVASLNCMIEDYCHYSNINFMSTFHLFNFRNGGRIGRYFMPSSQFIHDNCHLNRDGVTRMGKYIKYWTYKFLNEKFRS